MLEIAIQFKQNTIRPTRMFQGCVIWKIITVFIYISIESLEFPSDFKGLSIEILKKLLKK